MCIFQFSARSVFKYVRQKYGQAVHRREAIDKEGKGEKTNKQTALKSSMLYKTILSDKIR